MPPKKAKDKHVLAALQCGRYRVEENGDTVSIKGVRRMVLKQSLMEDGYARVCISVAGKAKILRAHRVVALALIPKPRGKNLVNHKDGVKSHNHPTNLEWVNFSENAIHALRLASDKLARCVA